MREADFFEDDDYDYDDDDDIEMILGDDRQKEILKWLVDSPLAERPGHGANKADFFIRHGSPVRLKDGTIVEAVSWLESEGFDESLYVEGYTVSIRELDQATDEVMIFTKREMVDAPFEYEVVELSDTLGSPDDIPF